jgi:hypothetical protein
MTHAGKTAALLLAILAGCASQSPQAPLPTEKPKVATDIPIEQAKPQYWFNQPPVASVAATDFQTLWDACNDTAHEYQFAIDLSDYRSGLLITRPMVSMQFFEPWRKDAGNFAEVMQSSLQTIRRTVHFELRRDPSGVYQASPKVLIERYSLISRRITSETEYRYAFMPIGPSPTYNINEDVQVPVSYWYAIGRDTALERKMADTIEHKLKDLIRQHRGE